MTEPMESWIGKTVVREDVVTPRLNAEFRATLAPFLFTPENKDHASPGLHWCLALPAHDTGKLGPDGAEAKGLFLPPVALPRRMWAGGAIESFRPFGINDKVVRTSTVSEVKSRDGKSGALCLVSITHEITRAGELAVRERHDIVFREASTSSTGMAEAREPPRGDIVWQVGGSPLLLFRFSAITFNGHRIHYDLCYAKETEGYGGLLVHGPLQAALLLNQLSVLKGVVPSMFSYRCTAPLVAGPAFHVASKRDSTGVIADANGVITMEAKAHA